MEQHIHCGLCGRVIEGKMPIPFTGSVANRHIVCDTCMSALNIKKEA
ncbi:hypothetical protein LCGC14_2792110 [marine sediment metagenome]|uniref:Uncharacterized protein n=1 Tax=marine sediment metagenome TaxID=412755 RepID=A0A0F8YQB9_9ZZZZ